MTRLRLRILYEDDLELRFVDDVQGTGISHEAMCSLYGFDNGKFFTQALREWAETVLYPLVKDGPGEDTDVLVTFLDSDPDGDDEMEFYFDEGGRFL